MNFDDWQAVMDHDLRRHIILSLIHEPRQSFNQLWDKNGESNKFAYHLKRLEEEGLVEKRGEEYSLTTEGRKLSTYIEGDTGGQAQMPTSTVVMIARDGDRILAQQRLKEPFHGYWGFPSGKLNYGWNPDERCVRDFREESGLEAQEFSLRALEHVKTYEEGELLHHHIMYIYFITKWSGKLIERTHKARHEWLDLKDYLDSDRFPGDWLFEHTWDNDDLVIMDADRFMEDGRFIGSELKKAVHYKRA